MSYVTAVTNRTLSNKGYWNVADWTRVYGNARLVGELAAIMLDTSITFNTVTAPTITTITSVTDFNTLLANIERLRLAVAGEAIPGTLMEIKDDYIAGIGEETFNYEDVNLWESTLDAIWNYFDGPDLEVCPTLAADLTVLTDTQYIVVDCLDANGYNITVQDGATLAIIS